MRRHYVDETCVLDAIIIKKDDSSFHPRSIGLWIRELFRKIVEVSVKAVQCGLRELSVSDGVSRDGPEGAGVGKRPADAHVVTVAGAKAIDYVKRLFAVAHGLPGAGIELDSKCEFVKEDSDSAFRMKVFEQFDKRFGCAASLLAKVRALNSEDAMAARGGQYFHSSVHRVWVLFSAILFLSSGQIRPDEICEIAEPSSVQISPQLGLPLLRLHVNKVGRLGVDVCGFALLCTARDTHARCGVASAFESCSGGNRAASLLLRGNFVRGAYKTLWIP